MKVKGKALIEERLFNCLTGKQIGELAEACLRSKTFLKKRSYKLVLSDIDECLTVWMLANAVGRCSETESEKMIRILQKYKQMLTIYFVE